MFTFLSFTCCCGTKAIQFPDAGTREQGATEFTALIAVRRTLVWWQGLRIDLEVVKPPEVVSVFDKKNVELKFHFTLVNEIAKVLSCHKQNVVCKKGRGDYKRRKKAGNSFEPGFGASVPMIFLN